VRRLVALGLLLAALAGCRAPVLDGARFDTERYSVRTDVSDPRVARRIAAEAERVHTVLRDYFGGEPAWDEPLAVLVADDPATYARLRLVEGSGGEYQHGALWPAVALVRWRDEAQGRRTLAHELVHHFVAARAPDLPLWLNEGLAEAIDHASRPLVVRRTVDAAGATVGLRTLDPVWCGVDRTRRQSDAQVLAALGRLEDYDAPDSDTLEDQGLRHVAAALVRHGLETEDWETLTDLADWTPDHRAFLRWLREVEPGEGAHRRFRPLLDGSDAPEAPFAPELVALRPPEGAAAAARAGPWTARAEDREVADRVAAHLERLRAGLAAHLGREPTPLVVHARRDMWHEAPSDAVAELGWGLVRGAGREPFGLVAAQPPGHLDRRLVRLVAARERLALWPDAPAWVAVGLAEALDHGPAGVAQNPYRCPVAYAREADPARLAVEVEAVLAAEAIGLATPEAALAGALVRFGLETAGWSTLAGLRGWRPEPGAFLRWLESADDYAATHTRFGPLLE